jgi:predicted metalloprotease
LAAAQRPEKSEAVASAPRVGIAVGAALLLAVVATLVLGIAPGEVLRAAEAGAHTLQAPSAETSAPGVSVAQEPKP